MAIFPLAPDQTIAQMWSNGVRAQKSTLLASVYKCQDNRAIQGVFHTPKDS